MSAPFHVATVPHEGRLWDAYIELDPDPERPEIIRARLRFDCADRGEGARVARTAVIIIEDSYEMALRKVRGFDERQLEGLLRSALPDA